MDEIPVAKREINPDKKISRLPGNTIFLLGGGLIILVAGWFLWSFNNQPQSNQNNQSQPNQNTPPVISNNPPPENTTEPPIPENILGHLPYEQAPTEDLVSLTADNRIRLRSKAANKYKQMKHDARKQGIILVPLSGFRTVSEQEYLFFEIKAQRKQNASKRAEVSAPPGYSEHHTGYAIDIGDGNAPATHLSTTFEQTAAYRWLANNATKYSFELSFPRDNLQGITYEPWHWRYVGDRESLETFYKVHQLKTNLQQQDNSQNDKGQGTKYEG